VSVIIVYFRTKFVRVFPPLPRMNFDLATGLVQYGLNKLLRRCEL